MDFLLNLVGELLKNSLDVLIIMWGITALVKTCFKHIQKMKEIENQRIAIEHGINPYHDDVEEENEEPENQEVKDGGAPPYRGYSEQMLPPQ
jgi:hypothetical protein